jgi:hypothetical protein
MMRRSSLGSGFGLGLFGLGLFGFGMVQSARLPHGLRRYGS